MTYIGDTKAQSILFSIHFFSVFVVYKDVLRHPLARRGNVILFKT